MNWMLCVVLFFPFITHSQDGPVNVNKNGAKTFEYDSLLKDYYTDNINFDDIPWLIRTCRELGNRKLADSISNCFVNLYISSLSKNLFLKKNIICLFTEFNSAADNRPFRMFYLYQHAIDQLMEPGYAEHYIDYIISKTEIDSHLFADNKSVKGDIRWGAIQKKIRKKYGKCYAERTIINAQVRWYSSFGHKDTAKLVKCLIKKMEKYGLDTAGFGRSNTNNLVFYIIFFYCKDSAVLKDALKWMQWIVQEEPSNPNFADTYANLLYKLGRQIEAIAEEEKAFSLSNFTNRDIQSNLRKMRDGIPTWTE